MLGLTFFEDLGLPSRCDLSISSDLIVSSKLCCSLLMIFSSVSSAVSSTIPCIKGNCAVNIAPVYLLLHPFRQAFYLNSYFLFLKVFFFLFLITSSFFFKSFFFLQIFLLYSSCLFLGFANS